MTEFGSAAQDPETGFESGERALRDGDLDQAQAAFESVLKADPNDAGAHANLGVIHMRRKEWKSALNELRRAEKLAPQVIGIRLNIGLAEFRRGDYPDAIPALQSVLEAQPESMQARYWLGLCYFLTERYDAAYRTLVGLRTEQGGNLQYLYAFGISAENAGFREDSQWAIAKLSSAGDSAEVHVLIGKAHLAREALDAARTEFESAARIDPKFPFAHYYLGVLAKKRLDMQQARDEFLADAAIEPDVAYNYEELAGIAVAEGQNAAGEAYFKQALRMEPRLTTARYGLAKLYWREGKPREALAEADRAALTEKQSASLHYLRAQLLLALGRKAEAEKEFAISTRMRDSVRDDLERKISGKSVRESPIDIR